MHGRVDALRASSVSACDALFNVYPKNGTMRTHVMHPFMHEPQPALLDYSVRVRDAVSGRTVTSVSADTGSCSWGPCQHYVPLVDLPAGDYEVVTRCAPSAGEPAREVARPYHRFDPTLRPWEGNFLGISSTVPAPFAPIEHPKGNMMGHTGSSALH